MNIEVNIDTRNDRTYLQLEEFIHRLRGAGNPDSAIAESLALLTAEIALKGATGFEGPDSVIDERAKCAYAVASEPKWGHE